MIFKTGNDLKKWRKKNNLTQDELSKKIRYSKYRISHIESQNEKISPQMIERLTLLKEEIDPEPPAIIQAWDNLYQANADRNHYFNKEIKQIDESMANIINSIAFSSYEKAVDSFNLIIEYLNGYSEIMKLDYSDKKKFKKESDHIYLGIRSKFVDFKYKK